MSSPPVSVLAVHGNGGGGFRFARAAERMPPEVRFHAVTLPGFAGVPADPDLRSLRDFAVRVREELDQLPSPRVALGHGIGGSIVLEMLQSTANGTDGVILHAPVGARLDRRLFPKLMAIPGMRWLGRQVFSSAPARPFLRRLLFRGPVPADYSRRFFREYRSCQVFSQMFDLITAEWFSRLGPVDVPARLLWGGRERVLATSHVEAFERLLPRARVRVIEDWDHFPMIDAPADYAREIAALAKGLVEDSP
jgi:pimeloyl-ACP methyl ester carboxylesterase